MGVEINRLTAPEGADTVAVDGTALVNPNGAAYHQARAEDDEDEDEDEDANGIIEESKLAHSPPPASPDELHLDHNRPLHTPRQQSISPKADGNDSDGEDEDDDIELNLGAAQHANGFLTHDDPLATDASTGETAGVYLGILNLYAAAPQLLGTLINFIVFAIVEPGKSRELAGDTSSGGAGTGEPHNHTHVGTVAGDIFGGDMNIGNPNASAALRAFIKRDHADEGTAQGVNAIAVCMFIGGLSSIGAAYATWRLKHVR